MGWLVGRVLLVCVPSFSVLPLRRNLVIANLACSWRVFGKPHLHITNRCMINHLGEDVQLYRLGALDTMSIDRVAYLRRCGWTCQAGRMRLASCLDERCHSLNLVDCSLQALLLYIVALAACLLSGHVSFLHSVHLSALHSTLSIDRSPRAGR